MRTNVLVRVAIALVMWSTASWSACALLSPTFAAGEGAKRTASREGWPDTPSGTVARQWVEAFSTGEDAMREFLKQNISRSGLEKRGVSHRVENYRKMRERYGKLMLASVVREAKSELTVSLMASDGSTHKFVFAVATEPPHKLVSVSIVQKGFGHGGGGFHH